jgi:Pre-mRNA 3'-end-processing endonuclease polyadenylation factor C-term
MPRTQNGADVRIPFAPKRAVYVVGDAATKSPKLGDRVHGVLVQRSQHGDPCVMAPKDLGLYNKVAVGRVVQRQVMRLGAGFGKCRLALEMTFEGIDAAQSLGGIECIAADGALACRLQLQR